jgi:predicted nuclease with TOPRIM domain
MSNASVITMEEFSHLNGQLVQLRTQNFDLESKIKKMNQEYQNTLKVKLELESEVKKLQSKIEEFINFQVVTGQSKEKMTFKKSLDDNTQLRKTMGELQSEYEEHV